MANEPAAVSRDGVIRRRIRGARTTSVAAPIGFAIRALLEEQRLSRGLLSLVLSTVRRHISERDVEIVILRVAHLRSCEDALLQPGNVTGSALLGDQSTLAVRQWPTDVMRTVLNWPLPQDICPRERALVMATDELLLRRSLTPDTCDALRRHFNATEVAELCVVISQYDAMALAASALETVNARCP